MRPDIEQAIERDQRAIDVEIAGRARGGGNKHVIDADAYERIFGTAAGKHKSGTYVMRGGKLVPVEEAGPGARETRHPDNVNIRSLASGCMREQVPEFNRQFGHMGVKYEPNGTAVYRDTQAQRRVLAARGMFLKNDTRSPRNA